MSTALACACFCSRCKHCNAYTKVMSPAWEETQHELRKVSTHRLSQPPDMASSERCRNGRLDIGGLFAWPCTCMEAVQQQTRRAPPRRPGPATYLCTIATTPGLLQPHVAPSLTLIMNATLADVLTCQ